LKFSTSRWDSTKRREIEIKSSHTHTHPHTLVTLKRKEREISERLLNLLFCQESKVIGHVHQFISVFSCILSLELSLKHSIRVC
jgi:hypothetical protein